MAWKEEYHTIILYVHLHYDINHNREQIFLQICLIKAPLYNSFQVIFVRLGNSDFLFSIIQAEVLIGVKQVFVWIQVIG